MTDIKKYWEKLESFSEKPFYLNEVLELDKKDFFSILPVTNNSNNNLNSKINVRWWIGLCIPETDNIIIRHTSNPTK